MPVASRDRGVGAVIFPGAWTAPLCLIVGVALLWQLRTTRGTRAKG
ncbi:MAG TPA: hypothetical protein VMS04_22450 [Vicinamibacterales bacterium]|nr:hypothetical protein [Vicinamibacterales bacterium]